MARRIRTKKQRRAAIRDGYHFGLSMPSKEAYRKYLQSKWWQSRRLQMLQTAHYACQDCGARDCVLHVHHLHYCSLGMEKNIDLKVLCEPCHKKKHPNWK